MANDILECAKRVGRALIGREDPSQIDLKREADAVGVIIVAASQNISLRQFYDQVLKEPVPAHLTALVDQLPKAL